MSAPLYFLPGVYRQHLVQGERLSPTVLAGRGLTAIFGDVVNLASEVSLVELPGAGPGGTSGTILVPLVPGAEPPARLGYFPSKQTWHNQADQFWLGLDNELPPTPHDLRRTKQVGGYRMQLGEHEWLVPVLRRPDGSSECPSAFGWTTSGQFSTTVRKEYQALWEEAAELVGWFTSGDIITRAREDMPRVVDWCVRVLGVNYRFDRLLQTRLAVIGSDDWLTLLCYAIDWFVYTQLNPQAQKKTSDAPPEPTSSSPPPAPAITSPGSPRVADEDIDPAAGSSSL